MNSNKEQNIYRNHGRHMTIQLVPHAGESVVDFCHRLLIALDREEDHVIKATCFGSLQYSIEFEDIIRRTVKGGFPLTWVGSENCSNAFMNGIQLWMVKDVPVKYLLTDFNANASYFEDDDAQYLFLGNIISEVSESKPHSYRNLLEKIESYLELQGFTFSDVVRTWYFLDNILDWYDSFNETRTSFFAALNIPRNKFPASTGVGGKNLKGSAVTMELLAIKPKNNQLSVASMKSAFQPEAHEYGSSFSRGVKIKTGNGEWMSVSGTASIFPDGRTAFPGEFEKQTEYTYDIIYRLIQHEGFTAENIVRGTVYIKNKPECSDFNTFLAENSHYNWPVIITGNTICREDLLFEIELDLNKS